MNTFKVCAEALGKLGNRVDEAGVSLSMFLISAISGNIVVETTTPASVSNILRFRSLLTHDKALTENNVQG